MEPPLQARTHFISGLPRSGSSLLSAILRQNPRFAAGVTSPVAMLTTRLVQAVGDDGEFASFFSAGRRAAVLRGLFRSYYEDAPAGGVIFDTNRSWTGRMALLGELFPDARVICCVRPVPWIIDSVERIARKNPLQPSRPFDFKLGASVYARVDMLMDPQNGLIGRAWSTLREAWFGERADRLLIVNYDALVSDPRNAIAKLYAALGEAPFAHDFDGLALDTPDYDAALGLPGLHRVRARIAAEPRKTCLPPDLFQKYAGTDFWSAPPGPNAARIVC